MHKPRVTRAARGNDSRGSTIRVVPYAASVQLPVPLRRYGFKFAHLGLRIWWLIARPNVNGVKCMITDGERVLLVRHSYGQPKWDLPGGTMKRREQPRETARREMAEELGITLDGWADLGTLSGRADHRHDTMHCFHAELFNPDLAVDRGEIDEARWFASDRLPPNLGRYVRPILSLAPARNSAGPG
jgi:8-oxo-dGTP pyrophosphatase MutT (NUDIX family)